MEQDFEVGDVVVLKEHTYPKMVVRYIAGDKITCNWFNDNQTISEHTFYSNQLIKIVKKENE